MASHGERQQHLVQRWILIFKEVRDKDTCDLVKAISFSNPQHLAPWSTQALLGAYGESWLLVTNH